MIPKLDYFQLSNFRLRLDFQLLKKVALAWHLSWQNTINKYLKSTVK